MESFSGQGILRFADMTVAGSARIEANDDGDINVEFRCDNSPYHLIPYIGGLAQLSIDLEDGTLQADGAFLNQVGPTVTASIPRMIVSRNAHTRKPDEFDYRLANCVFAVGSHSTSYDHRFSRDALELNVDGVKLRATKLESYQKVVELAKQAKTAAVTANLLISGATSKAEADILANAFCELLSFATKNSVRWLSRESAADAGTETEFMSPQVFPLRTSWSLIPDISGDGRLQLYDFLATALPKYRDLKDRLGLPETIGWLLDSEMTSAIQPKFLLAFAAIERLRSRILKGIKAPALISPEFNELIDLELGDQIINLISNALGTLDDSTTVIVRKKLKDLNRPPISASLDALCEHFGIKASTKKMSHLRSRLIHAGDSEGFEFQDALQLYWELSQVLDVCILKGLGFRGSYHHVRTNWKERSIDAPLDDETGN
jgi:hypothetical protein